MIPSASSESLPLFQGLKMLRRLYLDENLLDTIPPGLPPTLQELKISENKLRGIDENSFQGTDIPSHPTTNRVTKHIKTKQIRPTDLYVWKGLNRSSGLSGRTTLILSSSIMSRSEQPGDSGAGRKPAKWGERGSSGLHSSNTALLPQTGKKPFPHRSTGSSGVFTGTDYHLSSFIFLKWTQSQSSPLLRKPNEPGWSKIYWFSGAVSGEQPDWGNLRDCFQSDWEPEHSFPQTQQAGRDPDRLDGLVQPQVG